MAATAQRTLSVEMEEATRALHERLMHHPFEKAISSGKFLRDDYVQYLSDFYTIFQAIESRVSACDSLQSGVWDDRLARASAIGKDLAFFAASPSAPAPSTAAHSYASYILSLPESHLYLLVAHIWCAVQTMNSAQLCPQDPVRERDGWRSVLQGQRPKARSCAVWGAQGRELYVADSDSC